MGARGGVGIDRFSSPREPESLALAQWLRAVFDYMAERPRRFQPQMVEARNLSPAGPGQWVSRERKPL